MSRDGVRALLLDFGGTLDADGIAWKERFRRLFEEEAAAADDFDRAFYAADDALVGSVPRDLSFGDTVARLASGIADRLGRPASADRVASRFLASARTHLARSAGVLAELHGRYRLGIVSNFYGNLEAVCRETGLAVHLDTAIDSAVVKAEKPDRRIFEAALATLGVGPRKAVFVGDSRPRDMEGARALGMRHVWMHAGDGEPCCPDDSVIRSFSELPGVLG